MYFRLEVKTDRGWEGLWGGLWYNRNGVDGDPDIEWSDKVWTDSMFKWCEEKLPRASLEFGSTATCWFTGDGWFEIGTRIEELLQKYAPKDKFRLRTLERVDELFPEYRDFYQVAIRENEPNIFREAVFA